MGLHSQVGRRQEGVLWVRSAHHEQPDGVDGADPGSARPKGTLRGRDHDRLRVRTSRDHKVDREMEAQAVVEKA